MPFAHTDWGTFPCLGQEAAAFRPRPTSGVRTSGRLLPDCYSLSAHLLRGYVSKV